MDITSHLVSHDVGGRGFGVELHYPSNFLGDVVHVLYEADEGCAADMERNNPRPDVYRIAPYALGERDGTATLNITANPYASSLLLPDPVFGKGTSEVELSGHVEGVLVERVRYDAVYADENRVERSVKIPVRALDSLIAAAEPGIGRAVDFLSIDTQGTEFEVLQGARKAIASNVLALTVEVEFRPMYEGQKLFPEIFAFAAKNGFDFICFSRLHDIAPERMPVGVRGADVTAFGDALFFRSLDSMRQMAPSERHLFVMGLKLAFIAVCYNRLSLAISLLEQTFSLNPGDEVLAECAKRNYFHFLERLYNAYRRMPRNYLYSDREALVEMLRRRMSGVFPAPSGKAGLGAAPRNQAHVESTGVGTVREWIPLDKANVEETDGASVLGLSYIPKGKTSVLHVRIAVNCYSETPCDVALAVFRQGLKAPLRSERASVAARGHAMFNIDFLLRLRDASALGLDVRLAPIGEGAAATVNGPEGAQRRRDLPPLSLSITEYDESVLASVPGFDDAGADAVREAAPSTEIEDVLNQHGFIGLAADVGKRRRAASPYLAPAPAKARAASA